MSSMGNQWRVIRHYLSITNLNAEVEKLVQKIKPASPEQWDSKQIFYFSSFYKNTRGINLCNYFKAC